VAAPSVSTERTSLRSLIGGRWAVSWQGYLLAWPWAVLFFFFSAPSLWKSDSLLEGITRGIVIATGVYIPVGIVMWLASVSILRHRRTTPVSIAVVAALGSVAWTTRSVALIAVLELFSLPSEVSPASRIVNGIIQGAISTVLVAWLLAKVSSFREQRRRLLSELVQEELMNERLRDDIDVTRRHLLSSVRERVDATIRSVDRTPFRSDPTPDEVELLAQASHTIAKDLARELWDEAAKSTRIGPMSLLRSAVANRPFALWAPVPVIALGLIVLPTFWPLADVVKIVTPLLVVSLLVSVTANAVTPRLRPALGMAAYGSAVLLLVGLGILMQVLMNALGLTPPDGNALPWLVALNFGALVPLIGLGAHIGRVQRDALAQLRHSITETEIKREALRREESRMRRDLAYALHGGLQADLTASTMRAQHALDEGDAATARHTLDEARLAMQRGWDNLETPTTDLRSTAVAVAESWDGIVDITLDVSVDREPNARSVSHVEEVLLEGIGNAVRHGRAKNISITIDDCDGDIHITITDDGIGVTGSRAGLGSAMLDDIAANAWSLTPAATGGSKLTVALPIGTQS
jgi:signal transduction histidine kinase